MNHINFHNDTVGINALWFNSHKILIEKIAIELDQINKIDELTTKFLGNKQKLKKIVDPLKPKRPKSAYLHFCECNRPDIKNKNPSIKIGDLMKELGIKWREASEDEKKPFYEKHLKAREIYQDDIEIYNKNK